MKKQSGSVCQAKLPAAQQQDSCISEKKNDLTQNEHMG